jgi:high affinity sulfate transporter 1
MSAEVSQPRRRILFPTLTRPTAASARADLIAGLTVWAVLVPESLAYATIAGVSPVVGLYAAPAALIMYAAFGSSRHLIVGPMSATAALSAAAVGDLATAGSPEFVQLTAAFALSVGLAALIAGFLRLGFLANFISEPVLKGFIIGVSMTIIVGQVPKLLGVEKGAGEFFEQLWELIGQIGSFSATTFAVGGLSLAVVLSLKRLAPKVPASLVVVIGAIACAELLNLADHGVELVGPIASGLPEVGVPDISVSQFVELIASSAAVMLIGFTEGLGAARSYAARDHYEIEPNRELVGIGAANAASGMMGGMVVGGSLSKTAVNGSAGAVSQFAGIATAVATLLTLLFLTSLFESLPEATLAAVVIAAVIELVDFGALTALYRVYTARLGRMYGVAARPDFIASVAALWGVLVFGTLAGLFIGIVISLLLILYRASRPNISVLGMTQAGPEGDGIWVDTSRHPDAQQPEGVLVVRVEGQLFFVNCDAVRQAVTARAADSDAVVLDLESTAVIDVSAGQSLVRLREDLNAAGKAFAISGEIGQVHDVMRKIESDSTEHEVRFNTIDAAVAAVKSSSVGQGPRNE